MNCELSTVFCPLSIISPFLGSFEQGPDVLCPGVGGDRAAGGKYKPTAFADLPDLVGKRLSKAQRCGFGSIGWYTTTVKLDLEARGLIERIEGSKPQRLRRVKG